jgi:hypothetical protein
MKHIVGASCSFSKAETRGIGTIDVQRMDQQADGVIKRSEQPQPLSQTLNQDECSRPLNEE